MKEMHLRLKTFVSIPNYHCTLATRSFLICQNSALLGLLMSWVLIDLLFQVSS